MKINPVQHKLYKVVRNAHGVLCSVIIKDSDIQLLYEVGKITRPKFGKIFTFGEKSAAQIFARQCGGLAELYECIGYGAESPKRNFAVDPYGYDLLQKMGIYWDNPQFECDEIYKLNPKFVSNMLPYTTVFCKSVKLTQKIDKF